MGGKGRIQRCKAIILKIGKNDADGVVAGLAQPARALIHAVAKLMRSLFNLQDFLHADVAAAVEHIGYGAVRYAGQLGDILDGCHKTFLPEAKFANGGMILPIDYNMARPKNQFEFDKKR